MIRYALLTAVLLALPCSAAQLGAAGAQPSSPAPTGPLAIRALQVARADRAPLAYEEPGGHVLFRVSIAGKPSWGMLDTGASHSLIDTDFARASGLVPIDDDTPIQTPLGDMTRSHVDAASVLLPGQMTLNYERLYATNLKALRVPAQRPVDFVLGQDLLNRFFVIVDPDKKTLVLAPSGLFKPSAQFQSIALKNGKPQLELRVDCRPVLVMIDTGKNGDLDLRPTAWERYVPASLPVGRALAMAANGKVARTPKAVLPRADFGPVGLTDVEVTQRASPQAWGDGSIGMGVLSRFRFVIDIHAGALWIAPRAGAPPSPPPSACDLKN